MPVYSLDRAAEGSSEPSGSGIGIPRWERAGSAVLGGALLISGLRRRSIVGAAMAVVGGWLSYRAIGGGSRSRRAPESDAGVGRDRYESEVSAASPTVERSVSVGRPAEELSEFVRDPENLGRVMGHFADVDGAGEGRHRWSVRVPGPLDRHLSWEMRLVEDRPGERLRWESVEAPALFEEWSVDLRPTPGDRGTAVTVRVRFDPLAGALGSTGLERLAPVVEALVGTALDRLKSLAETGEVPTTERNPSARGRGDLL